jgi:hypothetical protein
LMTMSALVSLSGHRLGFRQWGPSFLRPKKSGD